jgi:hypothetical protein
MTDKDDLKKNLGFVGLFADRGTDIKAADDYSNMLADSLQEDAKIGMIVAKHVYHNTFINWLLENYDLQPK